jgi:hypothetical protein
VNVPKCNSIPVNKRNNWTFMVKTNPIGILDIAVGTGTIASLKKFWASCLDHENPQTTFTNIRMPHPYMS